MATITAIRLHSYMATGLMANGSKAIRPKAVRLYGQAVKPYGYVVIWI